MNSGKISNLRLTAESGEADATKSATVTFEKETYVLFPPEGNNEAY